MTTSTGMPRRVPADRPSTLIDVLMNVGRRIGSSPLRSKLSRFPATASGNGWPEASSGEARVQHSASCFGPIEPDRARPRGDSFELLFRCITAQAREPAQLLNDGVPATLIQVTLDGNFGHKLPSGALEVRLSLLYLAESRRAAIASIWLISARCALTIWSQSARSSGSASLASWHMRIAPEW